MSSEAGSAAHQDELVNKVAYGYYADLRHKDTAQPKHLILFSGVPGSGKSTIARELARKFTGILLSNDGIRDRIVAADPRITPAEREECKLAVANRLLDWLGAVPNGLLIVDASCDRGYDYYENWSRRHEYVIILLRLDVARATIERRIRERGDEGYRNASKSLQTLDRWWSEWETFGKAHRPDMLIKGDASIEAVLQAVRRFVQISSEPRE